MSTSNPRSNKPKSHEPKLNEPYQLDPNMMASTEETIHAVQKLKELEKAQGPNKTQEVKEAKEAIKKIKAAKDAETPKDKATRLKKPTEATEDAKASLDGPTTYYGKKPSAENKAPDTKLHSSTPPAQTGPKSLESMECLSPNSEAVESGSVTPNSEGVKRCDRNVWHAPPGI